MSLFRNEAAQFAAKSGFVPGQSPAIARLNSVVGGIACTDIPVLLIGESGTGKEVYCRVIHRLSKNHDMPLRKVRCRGAEQAELAALKGDLQDCREDWHERPGTLFLDDIDELDLAGQKSLLSILPDDQTDEDHSNCLRIIASASKNLEKEIEAGRFRKELYFRISGVSLRLPPLRDRKEDIHVFMEHFLAKHSVELVREKVVLSDKEKEFLVTHEWPGNVRELANLARRIALLGDSWKAIEELGATPKQEAGRRDEPRSSSLKAAARTASRRAERDLIAKALDRTHWNRKRAAKELQISYKSLLYKIKQTGLEEKHEEGGVPAVECGRSVRLPREQTDGGSGRGEFPEL